MTQGLKLRLCALLCALALPWLSLASEDTRPSFPIEPRFAVQRFEDQHGMSAVTTTALGQDKQGFLWIGTQTGLYRYDGTRSRKMTEVESLIGHYVVDMLIAPDGTPWFAGNRGIASYKDGKFEPLPIPATSMPFLSGVQIFAVDTKGTVYVLLYKRGLLIIDPQKREQSETIAQGLNDWETSAGITRGPDDSIWFTLGNKLAHLNAGSRAIEVEQGMALPKERVVALVFGTNGILWLRTATKLARIDIHAHKLTFEKEVTWAANEEEGKPSLDREGKLLVPSAAGLYWQGPDHWRLLTTKQGLASNLIQSAYEDREGTLWVGGSGTGLDRLPGIREWSAWTTTEGLPDNSTWATLRDKQGRLWVSTAQGIGIWDGRTRSWIKAPQLREHLWRQIRPMLLAGDGSIWSLTITGVVVRIDPRTFEAKTYPNYMGRNFVSIQSAPDGSIWATVRSHLVRFFSQGGTTKQEEVPMPIGQNANIEYLAFSPSGILWATGPGTVYRYDGNRWQIFTQKDGLRGETITSHAALNDNEVWLAYNDIVGVTHLRLGADGLARSEFFDWDRTVVGRDSMNRMWFNGTDGIFVLWPDGRGQRLNHANGLIWDDLSPWTGAREEADGSFLIATSRGLSRYRPIQQPKSDIAPDVHLTSVSVGGIERHLNERSQVSASDGSFMVQFSPVILSAPEDVTCRYQLDGLERVPTETQLRELRYGGLPPGRYEFWVQCKNPDSKVYSSKASFRFSVMPSLWQTWWARLLLVLAVIAGFWVFVSIRTRALNSRKRELEKAVAQRSAELLQKNKELEEISLTDPLTATRNRRYFYETISTDIAQTLRSHLRTQDRDSTWPRQELIFILVDIDRFKRINDEMGHAAGDKLLQEVAKRIASVMRRSDDLVRWGGEEFLLVCRTTDRENASMLCNRVLEAVRELPFDVGNGVQVHKTCSIGWAPYPWFKDDVGLLSIENVIELADKALYLAKREGRNRSYGMLPAPGAMISEKSLSIENLRDCPPELVQII